MARRPSLLCAVTIAPAALWMAVPTDAYAQPQPPPPQVVIGLADDQTACGPVALAAVVRALLSVDDVERAKREVVIVATVRGGQPVRTTDGFIIAPYDAVSAEAAETGWLVGRGAYECPASVPTSSVGQSELDQLARAGGWDTENADNADQLRSLASERFRKAGGGRSVLLPLLVVLALVAAAAVVIALVVRARREEAVEPGPLPPPPPPRKPLEPQEPPKTRAPQSLGVSRQHAPPSPTGRPNQVAPPTGANAGTTHAFSLRPITTLDGVVGSKLRDDHPCVDAPRHGSAAVWSVAERGLQCTAVYTEKVGELGEDAEPSIVVDPRRPAILLGVYDGLGGAGSAGVERAGGLTYNEAFVASRIVREEVESWFLDGGSSELLDQRELHTRIAERLTAVAAAHLPARSSGIRSNLARTLPTTLALAVIRGSGKELAVEVLWAGDSRVFLLTPQAGLQQLTADHVRDADVLHQLVNDAPMSNMVSASNRFEIASSTIAHRGRAVVLCATDGVFGYVRTPGEVEHVLLQTLQASTDPASWGARLVDRVSAYTGDDATLAVAAFGYEDFDSLRSAFAARSADVEAEQHLPFANVDPGDHDAVASIRAETWSRYQTGYTALMPGEHLKARSR